MPLPESTQAATLSFDAAVHRALSRRLADSPYPHNSTAAPDVQVDPTGSAVSGVSARDADAAPIV